MVSSDQTSRKRKNKKIRKNGNEVVNEIVKKKKSRSKFKKISHIIPTAAKFAKMDMKKKTNKNIKQNDTKHSENRTKKSSCV